MEIGLITVFLEKWDRRTNWIDGESVPFGLVQVAGSEMEEKFTKRLQLAGDDLFIGNGLERGKF